MSYPVFLSKTSLEADTSGTAATITTGLDNTQPLGVALYALSCTADCWWAQGIADTVFTALASSDVATVSAGHNLITGDAVMVSNSGGALPAGLSAATVYWVSVLTSTTFKFYDTRAHALLQGVTGTIDLTTNGTGTQTVTTTSSAAAGSSFLPAATQILIDGSLGPKLSVIQNSGAGKASLTSVVIVR